MTSVQAEILVRETLEAICKTPGPFVTVYLPARHPGAADLPRNDRLRALIRRAAFELESRHYQGVIEDLLAPFKELAADASMATGMSDTALFAFPGGLRYLELGRPTRERLVVAAHPHVTPLLPEIMPERDFFVLAISKKNMRMGQYRDGECKEIQLPPSVPRSLEEALSFDQPDHNLENRSTSGRLAGQMRGVRFGTSSDRDAEDEHLHNYFRQVDRELARLVGDATLVLAGVESELAAYRRASAYPRLVAARPGSAERLSWLEIGERALEAIRTVAQKDAEAALHAFREETPRDRVLTGARPVLEAAREGRVHKLLISKGAEFTGLLGPLYPPDHLGGEQDLVNAAAVETIRGGGEVHVLDAGTMGEDGPIAAVLRYSRR